MPSLEVWFEGYARRRYGQNAPPQAVQAWQLLRQTVYDCRDGHANTGGWWVMGGGWQGAARGQLQGKRQAAMRARKRR
jgi:hypothetical protein